MCVCMCVCVCEREREREKERSRETDRQTLGNIFYFHFIIKIETEAGNIDDLGHLYLFLFFCLLKIYRGCHKRKRIENCWCSAKLLICLIVHDTVIGPENEELKKTKRATRQYERICQ